PLEHRLVVAAPEVHRDVAADESVGVSKEHVGSAGVQAGQHGDIAADDDGRAAATHVDDVAEAGYVVAGIDVHILADLYRVVQGDEVARVAAEVGEAAADRGAAAEGARVELRRDRLHVDGEAQVAAHRDGDQAGELVHTAQGEVATDVDVVGGD